MIGGFSVMALLSKVGDLYEDGWSSMILGFS